MNPAPARSVAPAVLAHVDIVIPNEHELSALVAGAVEVDDAGLMAAQVAAGAGALVMTLGSAGAALVTSGEVTRVAALAVEAVDTTGAGDTFVGALAAALTRREPLRTAVETAVAAAAVSVTVAGARGGMPRRSAG